VKCQGNLCQFLQVHLVRAVMGGMGDLALYFARVCPIIATA